jgi:thiamine-monophosphate kinase
MRVSELGEFGLIRKLRDMLPRSGAGLVVGPGDDTAILECEGDTYLAFTADMLIEGIHFDLSFVDGLSLGYKALVASLSDLAAVGGESPSFVVVSLGLHPGTEIDLVEEVYRGLRKAADRYGALLVGGDTVRSPERMVLSISLLGRVKRENLLLRSGAREGDVVMVTGELGDAAVGLAALQRGNRGMGIFSRCVNKHLRPEPRLTIGRVLRSRGASAAIDISDGLLQDLEHICEESGIGALVELHRIPVAPETRAAAEELGIDIAPLVLGGGEDYELLFTVAPEKAVELEGSGMAVRIGKTVPASEGTRVVDSSGREVVPVAPGYDHFRGGGE